MLHTCVQKFDVTGNIKNFANFFSSKQALSSAGSFLLSLFWSHPFLVLFAHISFFAYPFPTFYIYLRVGVSVPNTKMHNVIPGLV